MPLFFLLSGFCLALAYGKKNYKKTTLCCGPCSTTTACNCQQCLCSEEDIFDSWGFYYARMIRILPVYYAIYLFALPLVPLDNNELLRIFGLQQLMWTAFYSIYGVQMWDFGLGGGAAFGVPIGPSWTLSTLFFFYLVFPR